MPRPTDASITIRLWIEPHDGAVRARLESTLAERPQTARGTDEIVRVVGALIDEFRGAIDHR